jgi:phospholipid/cholesterol/gamma-HCH transport system substrate-binding protein
MSTLRLGLFIVATLAIFACGVFFIGEEKALFRSAYPVRADFWNVAGLNPGADVRVGGIRKGTVKSIDLPTRPGQKVVVIMDLSNSTRAVVRKDSVASVKSEGLMGDKYIGISFGSANAPELKDGDAIGGEPPVDISDLIDKTGVILDRAADATKNIDGAAGNLDTITASIRQGRGTAGQLIYNDAIYRKMNAAATGLQEDTEALKHNFLMRGFFKDRGFEDSGDLAKHEIAELPRAPSEKVFNYDAREIFARADTAKLKNAKALDEAGQFLQNDKFGLAVISARAGMKSDSAKERALTEARAMVIRDYLIDHFEMDDMRVRTMGAGKTSGAADNGDLQIIVYPAAAARNSPPSR